MTTIAYKDGIIAYDSRVCAGNTIHDDNFEKMVERNGSVFFISGATSEFDLFIDCFFEGKNIVGRNLNTVAFAVINGELWDASIDEEGVFWKSKLRLDHCYAYGTGADHALTAMDMGVSAAEAIKWAMKRDCKTGGEVRVFKINRGRG